MKALSYDDKYEGNLSLHTILKNRLNDLKGEIKVQLPCKVESVDYENNQVNVQILDYDTDNYGNLINYPIIPNVPIRLPETSGSAYLILPVRVGDIGTIEFFDTSIKDLIATGNYDYDYLEDWHNLNNGLFTNGFLPKGKIININSEDKIILKTTNEIFSFVVDSNDELNISASKINITSPVNITGLVNISGDLKVEGNIECTQSANIAIDANIGSKSFISHIHKDSQNGNTSAPL